MKSLFFIPMILATNLAYAQECFLPPEPVPCGSLGYEVKISPIPAVFNSPITVPKLGISFTPPPASLIMKRVYTSFLTSPAAGYQNLAIPSLNGKETTIDTPSFGKLTFKLGAGDFLITNGSFNNTPSSVTFNTMYICWSPTRRVAGVNAIQSVNDPFFGTTGVRVDSIARVCYPANYSNVTTTGPVIVCGNTPQVKLGPLYERKNFYNSLFPFFKRDVTLEGVDDYCEATE